MIDCCYSQPFQPLKWKMMMGRSLNEVTKRQSCSRITQLQRSDIKRLFSNMEDALNSTLINY